MDLASAAASSEHRSLSCTYVHHSFQIEDEEASFSLLAAAAAAIDTLLSFIALASFDLVS